MKKKLQSLGFSVAESCGNDMFSIIDARDKTFPDQTSRNPHDLTDWLADFVSFTFRQ